MFLHKSVNCQWLLVFPLYSEESTQSALHSCWLSLNTGCIDFYNVHRKHTGQTKEAQLFLCVIVFSYMYGLIRSAGAVRVFTEDHN